MEGRKGWKEGIHLPFPDYHPFLSMGEEGSARGGGGFVFQPFLQHLIGRSYFLGHGLTFFVHFHILGWVIGHVGIPMRVPGQQQVLVALVEGCRREGWRQVK